jgi:hypothetical protein
VIFLFFFMCRVLVQCACAAYMWRVPYYAPPYAA